MNKSSLFIPALLLTGLFSLGVFIGISVVDEDDDVIEVIANDRDSDANAVTESAAATLAESIDSIHLLEPDMSDRSLHLLEAKVTQLEARIVELEQALSSKPDYKALTPVSGSESRLSRLNNQQFKQALLKAGINETMAEDIIQRRNDLDLKKLELNDRAIREDYIGSARYQSEYAALSDNEKTLREELGDEAYDRYLYSNGQTNRVKALSVITGSAADQAGIKDDDIILSYAQQRMFDWTELKQATTEGFSGEYVNVDIVRGSQRLSLTVPRGPLGVRLGMARVLP